MKSINMFISKTFTILISIWLIALTISIGYAENNTDRLSWDQQTSGTINNLYGVSCKDTQWATTVGESGIILNTNDGSSWHTQSCDVTDDLKAVSFYDTSIGLIGGYSGTIIYTTDGGAVWTTYQNGWMITYYGAHMVTDQIGYVVGENSIFQPLVTWTTDGWNSNNDATFYLEDDGGVGNEGKLSDVCFVNTNTGFASGISWNGKGAVVRTEDGGWNWDTVLWYDVSGSYSGLHGIDFPTENIGYAVGDEGIILKTEDGGDSWNTLTSGTSTKLNDVSFSSALVGIVVGEDGLILRTEDGGSSWTVEDSTISIRLNSVSMLSDYFGYAVGDVGQILNRNEPEPPPQILAYNPQAYNAGAVGQGGIDQTTFEIWNQGTDMLNYSLTESSSWIEVTPLSGNSTGEHDTITIDLNTTGFLPGFYQSNISISSNGGYGTFTVKVYIVDGNETVDVNQTIHDRGFPIRYAMDGAWGGAQSFKPTTTTMTRAEVYLRRFGNPEFDLKVEIHKDTVDGPLLDTLTYSPCEVDSSWQWINIGFSNTAVIPGDTYMIVIAPPTTNPGTSFGYEWGYAFGNQYDDGAFWFTRDGGGLWRDLPTMYEFVFKTFGYS